MPYNTLERVQRNSERITALETQMETQVEPLVTNVELMRRDIHQIKLHLEKSKGFVGGFAAAFTLLGAGFCAVVGWALHKTGVV